MLINHYKCERCAHEWSDEWECAVDDDCPSCGARHMTPHTSEDAEAPKPAAKPRYTEGPWKREPLQSTMGADIAIVAPSNGWVVAVIQHDPDIQTCEEPDGDSVVWHDQDLGNADLIMSAPELARTLRALVALAERTGIADCDPPEYVEAVAVLAAIDGNGKCPADGNLLADDGVCGFCGNAPEAYADLPAAPEAPTCTHCGEVRECFAEDGAWTCAACNGMNEPKAESFAHSPDTCPSKHWNRGDDICADCGADLA